MLEREWLEYPENEPESKKRYWVTLRVMYKIMEHTPNESVVMQSIVLMADFFDGEFYYIGFDGTPINPEDDGQILAFMPIEDEPEPFGGENYIQIMQHG